MHVRVISFGTNWWAMHSSDTSDPYRFRRGAAYFNAAALMCGRRLRHNAIYPGQIRFNAKSGFDPEFPSRAIGRTFLCSGPNQFGGRDHLLFRRPATLMEPDAYLVTLNAVDHGPIFFDKPGWRSSGVHPISISLRGSKYEAILLLGMADWIQTDLGRWRITADGRYLALSDEQEGARP
jgi:hypothetical protein